MLNARFCLARLDKEFGAVGGAGVKPCQWKLSFVGSYLGSDIPPSYCDISGADHHVFFLWVQQFPPPSACERERERDWVVMTWMMVNV